MSEQTADRGRATYHHHRRLDRALHHLESLKAGADDWLEEEPYRTWTEPDGRKKLLWVEVLGTPPDELSLIIGDRLHNLRSALDNLSLELALAHKGEPLPKGIEGDSAFPILTKDISTEPESLKKFNRMTRGIDPRAKAEIERLQPYKRGQRFATNDPLWQLNELYNTDKHRLPHVTLFVNVSLAFWVPTGPGADAIEPLFGGIEGRAPIARYPAFDETGAEVDVHLQPAFDIGFGDLAPKQLRAMSAPNALRLIHLHIVNKVLPPLAPYLR